MSLADRNFIVRLISYESRKQKFHGETRENQIHAALWAIAQNYEEKSLISRYELWFCLFASPSNCESCKCDPRKLHNISLFPFSRDLWDSRDSQWYFRENQVSFSTKFSREKLRNETRCQPYSGPMARWRAETAISRIRLRPHLEESSLMTTLDICPCSG